MLCAIEENLEKTIRHLSETIGIRLGGSKEEYAAATYMQKEFQKYLPSCVLEPFPVNERCVESETLEVFIDGEWRKFGGSLLGGAPTTNGKTIEAELVFFDSHTDYQRKDLSFLTGKAVIHYGVHIQNSGDYRRLMEAKPAFLLMVDTRHPGNVPLADGLFPTYVAAYGAVPSVNVAAFAAREWVGKKAPKARLTIAGGVRKSNSYNVIAELPGTAPDGKIIYACGHTDTQAGCPGADDNAVACAITLELARILSETPHKRTIRFIDFGTEEQLSVGSCAYLDRHADEIKKGGFICNFDECGTAIGWTMLHINTTPTARQFVKEVFNRRGIYYVEDRIPQPFDDFFPFTAAGIGGFSCERSNSEISIDYHHRADDTIDKLSMAVVANHVDATAEIMAHLADAENIDDFCGLDAEHVAEVQARWQETFVGER